MPMPLNREARPLTNDPCGFSTADTSADAIPAIPAIPAIATMAVASGPMPRRMYLEQTLSSLLSPGRRCERSQQVAVAAAVGVS